MSTSKRLQPAIIIALLAALVLVCATLVLEKARHYEQNTGTTRSGEQQVYRWTMVTSWPPNLPGLGEAAQNLADYIRDASDNRLQISIAAAGELVPGLGVFDAVSAGNVEMGHSAAYYWKGKIPAAQFFTSVPFGLNAQEMNGWLHYGGGLELWREVYAPFNLVPFAAGNTGIQMAGWFNKEINSLADLKGLKMRIPGLGGEVFSRAGGTAVTIAGGELYTAMETGVIDATEWVAPYNDMAFGLHKVARYYYYPGWQEPGPTLELIVNKSAYDNLPEDLKSIITIAARAVNQDMLDGYTSRNNASLQQLRNDPNIEIRKLPDDVLNKLRTVAEDIYRETAAQDPQFKRVYEAYRQYMADVRNYHAISEEAYYQSLASPLDALESN